VLRINTGLQFAKFGDKFMEALLPLIIQLVSGAVGGGAIGALVKKVGMGNILNLVVGAIGGAGTGPLLGMLGGAAVGDAAGGGMLGTIVGSLAGGGALTGVAGLLKNMLGNK